MKFIDPRIDFAFKKIFGSEDTRDILTSFPEVPGTPCLIHFPDIKMRQDNWGKKTELSKVSPELP